MAERDADFFKVMVGQIAQNLGSMSFSAKRCAYCPRPSVLSQYAICCIGSTDYLIAASRILDYGEKTLSRSSQHSMLWFAAFGRG
jgi:hypothetical protein